MWKGQDFSIPSALRCSFHNPHTCITYWILLICSSFLSENLNMKQKILLDFWGGVNLECLLYPRGHISSHVQSVAMIIIQSGEGAGKYEINEQMS